MKRKTKQQRKVERKAKAEETALLFDFMNAAFHDRKKATQMLAAHPELKGARRMGETSLHFLAVEGHADVVKFLFELGFDVNTVSEGGTTPLIDVCITGNDQMAELLLSLGANPNATCDTWGCALFAAIRSGKPLLIRRLLSAGANPNYIDDGVFSWKDNLPDKTEKHEEIIRILKEFGAML